MEGVGCFFLDFADVVGSRGRGGFDGMRAAEAGLGGGDGVVESGDFGGGGA